MVDCMEPVRRRRACGATFGGVLVAGTMLAGGCSGTLDDVFPEQQPSYQSSRSVPPLEVPPDLTSSTMRDSLQIPGADPTYSQYSDEEGSATTQTALVVLPTIEDAKIERSGDQRWLVVAMKPDEIWPRLRDYWTAQGFALESEEPDIGVMETEWAARHEPLPAGAIKRALLRVGDVLYGVDFRDRYRTRIERGTEPGTVEIYISHQGAEQEVVGDKTNREGIGTRVWQPRPNDPGLEAEMLTRLMVFLGVDEQQASTTVAASARPAPRARFEREDGGDAALVLDVGFSQAWRRTGLALDRAGFRVEDRDRSRGLFFLRYTVRDGDSQREGKGWFSTLKFWDSDAEQVEQVYVVRVIEEASDTTRVVIVDSDGARVEGPDATQILTALYDQLR